MITFSEDGLSAIATKLDTPLMLDSYTSNMCMQSRGRSSYARAMIEFQADGELKDTIVVTMYLVTLLDECPKNIVSDMVKNLKNRRQSVKGVQVGPKQVVVASKDASNSNPFDVLNSVENDDDLGTNRGHSKSAGMGPNSDVFSSDHRFFNVTSSSTSTTPIVERIDKIERKIINGKLTLVDDNGKLLPKVVSMAKYG
nr:hypothetical protein [Tanacetum cinerariifolium]